MADDATAEQLEGQDGASNEDVPYRTYLERVPEQVRGEIEPVFKDWNSHVNSRFEQHADYRKQWEPYEQIGANQIPPEELQGWLQFRQAAHENPQAIQQWFEQYAAQNGLTPQQQAEQFEQTDTFVDPTVEQLLEQKLGPLAKQYEELRAWRDQQEEQRRVQQATEQIEQQMASLAEKHGGQFDRPLVEKFIANYIETDPKNAVERAFKDSQDLVASIEKQLMSSKLKQPAPAEAGGGTNAGVQQPRSLEEARKLALEQLRGITSA